MRSAGAPPSSSLTSRFQEHFRNAFALHLSRLSPHPALVVGCSGGGDSVALVALLATLPESPFRPVVVHVVHGLRGESALFDERLTAEVSQRLDLPYERRDVDVPGRRRKGESLEAAARRLRYETLFEVARSASTDSVSPLVATGHTLDDQAETVLLNLLRHAGRTRGGIRPIREDGVLRPLLPFTRHELREFLRNQGLPWREDESNADPRFVRNRLRHSVLPALEAASPGTSVRLARAADAWTLRLDALDAEIATVLTTHGLDPQGPFPRALVDVMRRELAGRFLVRLLGHHGAVPGRAQIERVLSRLTRGDSVFVETIGGKRIHVTPRRLRLAVASPNPRKSADRLRG